MSDDEMEIVYENILTVSSQVEESNCTPRSTIGSSTTSGIQKVCPEAAHRIKSQANLYIQERYKELANEHQNNNIITPRKDVNSLSCNSNNLVPYREVMPTFKNNSKIKKRKLSVLGSGLNVTVTEATENGEDSLTDVNKIIALCDTYCLENLKFYSEVVLSNNIQLFSKEEINLIQSFFNMNSECQTMYSGMFSNKYKWRKLSDYQYASPVLKNVNILLEKGFLTMDFSDSQTGSGLDGLLEIMKINELRKLCESLDIVCTVKNKNKCVKEILECLQSQKPTRGKIISTDDMYSSITNIIGNCFTLCPEPYKLFRRIYFLFHLKSDGTEHYRDDSQFGGASNSKYPVYSIDRITEIFASRNDMLRFQTAADLWIEFSVLVENKKWVPATKIIKEIRKNFNECIEHSSSVSASQLPLCLREYTSGTIYAYALSQGIQVLKKLKKRDLAILDLLLLLKQKIYLPYIRGRWYEQLIRFYQISGAMKQVAQIVESAMKDQYVDEQAFYVISCSSEEILRKKKGVLPEVKNILNCVPPVAAIGHIECNVIKILVDGKVGCEQLYVTNENREEIDFSFVEDLIKSHYCPRHYMEGIYNGNNLMLSLFGLLFWDMIYEHHVKYTFIRKCQIQPLDLNTGEFYQNRKDAIDMKVAQMCLWTSKDIGSCLEDVYYEQKGKISMVHWKLFPDFSRVLDIINSIGWTVVLKICERIAKNYRDASLGFPAMFLWTPVQNKYKFVEVQFQKDSIEVNQKLWRKFLLEINANIEICYITGEE